MVRNKVGRPYLYLQRGRGTRHAEKPIRLPDDPASPDFWAEYARLMALPQQEVSATSVSELIRAWQASPQWAAMKTKTQTEWSRYCERINAAWGPLDVRGIEPRHVLMLQDRYADRPAAANNLLRCLSSMLGWAVPRGWRADNPCREVKPLKGGEGYAPWSWDVIQAAKAELRQDLWWVVALALYTGQRQGDVLKMRWDAITGGMIMVRQEKTGKRLAIPLHKDLRDVLATIPQRAVTVATSTEGRPWTKDGFKATWNKHRPLAIKGLVFHGLRKSAVVTLLECGCTDAEVAAITGQSREMIQHYAKQVNQQKLAAAAILRWEAGR
jgi:integrase